MHFRDLVHGLHLHKLKPKKELTEVYISISLRYLAFSMINLFIPIYLYHQLKYSLTETLIFFVIYALAFGIFTPFAAKLLSRIGVKHTILLAVPFYLIFFLLLHGLGSYPTFLYGVPLFFSAAQSLFWMGFHTEFIRSSDHDHRGREVSKFVSLAYAAILIGPLLGGFFIDNFGFPFLFVIVAVLFFISASFLFFTKDFREPSQIKFRHIFSKNNLKSTFTYATYGAQQMAESVLWPLFIFVVLKTYTNMGLLGSAMSAVIALFVHVVGKMSDKYNRKNIMRIGGIIYSLTWPVRALFDSIGFIFGITIFAGLAHTFLYTPLEAMTYDRAEKNVVETLVFREMALNLGRVACLLIVILTADIVSGFMFSAGMGVGYLFF